MVLSQIFGALAGITAILAYGFYLRQCTKGQSTPNPASWFIWFIAGVINSFTYFSVVGGNIWQSLFVIAVTISVFVILIYSLFKGKFTKIKSVEIVVLATAVLIGIFWQVTANDRISNLILQSIYVVSYIPTILGIIKKTAKEAYPSWITAVISYSFATLGLVVNYPGDWIALVSPMINGVLGNGIIVFLIHNEKKDGVKFKRNKT